MYDNTLSSAYHYCPRTPVSSSALWCQIDRVVGECADRYIPSRTSSNLQSGFTLLDKSTGRPSNRNDDAKKENSATYNQLLESELLGRRIDNNDENITKSPDSEHIFRFKSSTQKAHDDAFSCSPVSFRSADFVKEPRKARRKIAKTAFKVLDAPLLEDDFYLNLLDWSSTNVVAVALHNTVYLYNASTCRVTKLCELGLADKVTSVAWTEQGRHLSIGTSGSCVEVWDAVNCRKLRTMTGHTARVGAMAWNEYILTTGGRDHMILHRDVRERAQFTTRLQGHWQEVCGLKWSHDKQQLASGGNDNLVHIWNRNSSSPVATFDHHQAAVKALAWSPHQHGLLASGGGTADPCIRFWDTVNDQALSYKDTKSQVCNLAWAKHSNEIVSTHGYSQNQIAVWKYPSMTQTATLTGHRYRVLYLAMSPDGKTAVTGAGDETLRFWDIFPDAKAHSDSVLSSKTLSFGYTIR